MNLFSDTALCTISTKFIFLNSKWLITKKKVVSNIYEYTVIGICFIRLSCVSSSFMFTSITFQEAYGLRVPNWSWGMHIHRSGKWDTTIAHSSQDALKKSNFVGYYSAQQDINWHYHVHRILKSCNSQKREKKTRRTIRGKMTRSTEQKIQFIVAWLWSYMVTYIERA